MNLYLCRAMKIFGSLCKLRIIQLCNAFRTTIKSEIKDLLLLFYQPNIFIYQKN